jgi:hypothetical protein
MEIFTYSEEYAVRNLPHGKVTWSDREVVAISKPHITPAEAIEFYIDVEILLPQDWAEDPKIEMLSDGRVSIRGIGD